MAAPNKSEKPKKKEDKKDEFLGDIKYTNDLPDVAPDLKFLPCGKDLLDYTINPVSFPELESQHNYYFPGLESLLNLDLVTQEMHEQPPNESAEMDPRDAELLKDIEALVIKDDEK
ncbi:uncharacterized protein LOC111519107 [Drosophila willistoni]|uniref:uncharacterized protein LOC111519107 n=1 Tax=Drosophila willistoni TaxID=7260 RepID=UPI00017D823B|nr:uncharacterized protein LOC111519107 [Drosophila willistoni]